MRHRLALAWSTEGSWGCRLGPIGWLLLRHRVRYVVVGGAAVSYYVGPERQAADLDLVIALGALAARRAFAALSELVERAAVTEGPAQFSPDAIAEGADLIFRSRHGKLHITGSAPALARGRAVSARRWVILDRTPLALCSLDELIIQKRTSKREQDERDLRLLERANG